MPFRTYFFTLVMFAVFPIISTAAVMSSTNFNIEFDTINVAGTENSSSTTYMLSDTTGEVGAGNISSATYNLFAGYRQMTEVYLAISAPADVSMSPALSSASSTANGSSAWTVTTNSPSGYTLNIRAATSPALQSSGDSFADYTPIGVNPDFIFGIAATESEFGFTPEGADITSEYMDNGSVCNVGASDTADRCWRALSTTNQTIASRTSSNHPAGTVTTVKFRSEIGASKSQASENYSAITTITAISL